jgi:hypothetical protein
MTERKLIFIVEGEMLIPSRNYGIVKCGSRFHAFPMIVQYAYKRDPQTPGVFLARLAGDCHRSQRVISQKAAARHQFS